MRILVVEDDAKVGGFLEQGLQEEEYEVSRARDGEEALSIAIGDHYDLILLDYMLPKRSGPQVASDLRATGRQTPISLQNLRGRRGKHLPHLFVARLIDHLGRTGITVAWRGWCGTAGRRSGRGLQAVPH